MSRRSLTLGAVAALAIASAYAPARADAGGYDVPSCDASVAGGANNSWGPSADPGMTAYTNCPPGGGLVARNVYDGGTSGGLQGGYMIFDAPSGTYVESISFIAGWQRHDCSWSIGVVASNGDLGGNMIWGYPSNQMCGEQDFAGNSFFEYRYTDPVNASRVRIESRCGAAWCPRNGVAAMRLKDVVVHVHDDTPPNLSNGRGALWTSGGWLSGNQAVGFDAGDGGGIREAAVLVDGRAMAQHSLACDITQRAPCPPASLDETFPTAGFGGDGSHTVTLRAIDAGGNPSPSSHTVKIDNTPPDPPQNLTLDGGDGWRSTNAFSVRWTNAPQANAPIAGAEWQMCPAGGAPCVRGSKDGSGITSLAGLSVPG